MPIPEMPGAYDGEVAFDLLVGWLLFGNLRTLQSAHVAIGLTRAVFYGREQREG